MTKLPTNLRQLRESWTIEEIQSLPSEDDRFDRKAFSLECASYLSQTLSAFANSGGGHVLLGVDNDGTLSGCPSKAKGRQPTQDWISNLIDSALAPPLTAYRVHGVAIPDKPDRIVIVIDIDDSQMAPHQATSNNTYYYRVSHQSKAAPHFYLELLRHRTSSPQITAEPLPAVAVGCYEFDDNRHFTGCLCARIVNSGSVAARGIIAQWLPSSVPNGVAILNSADDILNCSTMPGARIADLLLPLESKVVFRPFGITAPLSTNIADVVSSTTWKLRTLSEVHAGDFCEVPFRNVADPESVSSIVKWLSPRPHNSSSDYLGYGITAFDVEWNCDDGLELLQNVGMTLHNGSDFDYDTVAIKLLCTLDDDSRVFVDAGLVFNLLSGQFRSWVFSPDKESTITPKQVDIRIAHVAPLPNLQMNEVPRE